MRTLTLVVSAMSICEMVDIRCKNLMAVSLIGGGALLAGCSSPDPDAPGLPDPSVVCPNAPPEDVLNAEQEARRQQVQSYLALQYERAGWKILLTTKTCLGDVWDWLDPASVPGSELEPPPPPVFDLPPGIELQQTELDLHPELRLPNSVPMWRPTFRPYVLGDVPANSVEDFLAQQVPGRPEGEDRLYAGIKMTVPNTGVKSFISAYDGKVERNTMTLMELVVRCRDVNANPDTDPTLEQVGVAIMRERLLEASWDETKPVQTRFMAELFTAGYDYTGDEKGGWHGEADKTSFVPAKNAPYGPGVLVLPPAVIGGPYYDSLFEIRNVNGNWWLLHNHNWLGYYPAQRFDVMTTEACEIAIYGENYDSTPQAWTSTDMGSGRFAAEGIGNAAYFRQPVYYDLAGMAQWPDGATASGPYEPLCYTSSGLLNQGPLFERVLYCGGPGGDSPGCKYSMP